MRVLVADDQNKVRSALKLLLDQESEVSVVGEAADVGTLLATLPAVQPDLLLLDWDLPASNWRCSAPGASEQFLAALRAQYPSLLVVVLSVRPESRAAAIGAGADGFVSKGEPPERLLAALRGLNARPSRRSLP